MNEDLKEKAEEEPYKQPRDGAPSQRHGRYKGPVVEIRRRPV